MAVAAITMKAASAPRQLPSVGLEHEYDSRYLLVLPVLFLEFLAIALARSLLPKMMVDYFGDWTYHVIGITETVKGFFAFGASPIFGKLSDMFGRRKCMLLTVLGTTFPVVSLLVTRHNLSVFVALSALSGIFAATFPLTFAYISDLVPKEQRAPAYGLALATFGLSFTIGPVAGGYLSKVSGMQSVFLIALVLVIMDVLFIIFVLPESKEGVVQLSAESARQILPVPTFIMSRRRQSAVIDYAPFQWNPIKSLDAFRGNVLLSKVAVIVFLYYTGVWALVSTLMIYVTKRFHFGTLMIGQLLGAFGVCMMFSEGILVRIMVPRLGEKLTLQIGLLGFASQCIMIGLATQPWMIYASILGSMLSHLVYPSVSSLVSRSVSPAAQGEVLGTMNGVRALTEGFGPLTFGFLMYHFEDTWLPGAPYLIAGAVGFVALMYSFHIPDDHDEEDGPLMTGTYGVDVEGYDRQSIVRLLSGDDSSDDGDDGGGGGGGGGDNGGSGDGGGGGGANEGRQCGSDVGGAGGNDCAPIGTSKIVHSFEQSKGERAEEGTR